jgi:Alpha/beta hydrolase domain
VLGGLHPERLLAAGESQSAGRMVTYIDAVHPVVHVYDGFLVHSRGAGGAALSQAPLPAVPTPSPTFIRDDLNVPVLVFQTETDVGGLQARPGRQSALPIVGGGGYVALRPVRAVDRPH